MQKNDSIIYDLVNNYVDQHDRILFKEDIKAIGLEHIALPIADRNWYLLAKLVQYNGTGVQYRKAIERERRKLADNYALPDAEFRNEYIQKTQIRDIHNAYKRTLRDTARLDTLCEALCDSLEKSNFNLPQVPTRSIVHSNTKEGVLLISDWHIGVNCDNFYNKYDKNIAWTRIESLAQDTIQYCKIHNVDTLNVVALGDFIQGIIHTGARIESELDIADEITTAANYIAHFLNQLKAGVSKIVYRTCTDNHSRAIADKDAAIETENFGKVIDFIVKLMLKDVPNIVVADDNLDPSIGRFTLNNGKTVMYAHGHLDNINTAFQNFIGASREFVDYIFLAHYHSEKTKSFQGTKVFVNGSLCGTEQYAVSRRLFSNPSQKLLIFDTSDSVIDISISVE